MTTPPSTKLNCARTDTNNLSGARIRHATLTGLDGAPSWRDETRGSCYPQRKTTPLRRLLQGALTGSAKAGRRCDAASGSSANPCSFFPSADDRLFLVASARAAEAGDPALLRGAGCLLGNP